MNTREKILQEALKLFSVKGFAAVSVREIAGKVGIKESSLYNHFKNKQDIFDKLLEVCWEDARNYFKENSLPFAREDDITVFHNPNIEELLEVILQIFGYFFKNEKIIMFRKVLILSQYEYERAAVIYRELFVDYMLGYQSDLFKKLIGAGALKECDPNVLAMEFYGPVFLLIHTQEDFEKAKPELVQHFRQFIKNYGREV